MKIKEKRFFELIREYLTVFLPLQKSSSSHTIKSYKETLNAFLTFLCSYLQKPLKDISFSSVTPDSINAFLQWLEVERGCKTSTLNHHLSVIRAFLKYAGIRAVSYTHLDVYKRQACNRANVPYTVSARPKMVHCYCMLPIFKEAKEDFAKIVDILKK